MPRLPLFGQPQAMGSDASLPKQMVRLDIAGLQCDGINPHPVVAPRRHQPLGLSHGCRNSIVVSEADRVSYQRQLAGVGGSVGKRITCSWT